MKADRTDGFQRGLLELHAKSMARDLVGAFKADFLRLTSAIQLTTTGSLEYDDERGGIWIDFSLQYPPSGGGGSPPILPMGNIGKWPFPLPGKKSPKLARRKSTALLLRGSLPCTNLTILPSPTRHPLP